MNSNWNNTTLGEEIQFLYGKGLPKRVRQEGDIPVYGSNGIIDYHNEALVKGPGIVIGRKGSVGEIKYSNSDFFPIDTTYYLKLKKEGDLVFWYYFLQILGLPKMNTHSAVPGLNRELVYQISVKIPNPSIQKKIALILKSLDAKIEVNTSINTALEELGSTLFKRWFVDFEFPDESGEQYRSNGGAMKETTQGEIPLKWEIYPLDRVAHFLNGLALQKYPAEDENDFLPVIKIRELRNGITDVSDKASRNIPPDYIIENGDVLFSWSGSLLVKIWTQGEGALNQHLFKVTSEYPQWFYYYWIKHHLYEFQRIAADKATTMGHIKRNHLSEANVLVPDTDSLSSMTNYMEPIIELMINQEIENNLLSELRDVLLPRLMSGKIRVPMEDL